MISFLFSLAFVVLGFFFLIVAAMAGWGIVHMLRDNQRTQLYLEASRDEKPLQIDHLSGPLQQMAQQTRFLRISIESHIRNVAAFLRGEFVERASQDQTDFDNMLMDLSRQVADWVSMVDQLPEADQDTLLDLGVDAHRIRATLDAEGGAFERRNLERRGLPPLDRRLEGLATELAAIETSLQSAGSRVYR